MTLFEYMSVAVSLIAALAFAEGLRGLHSALMPDRRYIIHALWLIQKLLAPATFWWAMWGFRNANDYWNFGTYFMTLSIPALLYLQIASLVGDTPYQVKNWRIHFYDQRKWFFGINILLCILAVIAWSGIFSAFAIRILPTAVYLALILLSIIGYFTDNPKVHGVIVSTALGFNVLYHSFATFNPV